MNAHVKGAVWLSPIGFRTSNNRDWSVPSPFITKESMQEINQSRLPRVPNIARACCAAVDQTLLDAGLFTPLLSGSEESVRTGLVVGNNFSSIHPIQDLQKEAEFYGPNRVNPAIFPNTVYNALAGYIAIHANIKGTNTTLSGGIDTVPAALFYGLKLLEKGRHDRVIVCNVHLHPLEKQNADVYSKNGADSSISFEERITVLLLERPGVGEPAKYSLSWELKKVETLSEISLPDITESLDIELVKLLQDGGQVQHDDIQGRFQNGDLLKMRFKENDDFFKKGGDPR
ncbi:beta-ketoacyl synthase N-terminal-like domain-containing protein [Paenibacillus dendritiformis]|uniref:beta-ketoacyl synthase N-terminal-like domain-containing protein n=1 Tax=Paenibacillus dendritiformis TaxID=130049 RepID=UPI0018CD923F|nr:beta-ketoacyl synthase N-terminal-like domain-containing protein [Paenibacillus dendritiformis]